jgi:hypothetical protein
MPDELFVRIAGETGDRFNLGEFRAAASDMAAQASSEGRQFIAVPSAPSASFDDSLALVKQQLVSLGAEAGSIDIATQDSSTYASTHFDKRVYSNPSDTRVYLAFGKLLRELQKQGANVEYTSGQLQQTDGTYQQFFSVVGQVNGEAVGFVLTGPNARV